MYGIKQEDLDEKLNEEISKIKNKANSIELNNLKQDFEDNKKDIESHLAENEKQLETKMNKQIKDDATAKKYELGMKNGFLYYKEVI